MKIKHFKDFWNELSLWELEFENGPKIWDKSARVHLVQIKSFFYH